MRILRLDRLMPGDLILETGHPSIAAATGGLYGHASIALCGLAKIEAESVDRGVVINPFEFDAWHQDRARVAGVPIGDAALLVMRKRGLGIGQIDGEALWEAGRRYSVEKLLELPDLSQRARELLRRRIGADQRSSPGDPEARFCSEVAARILHLPKTALSPNELAHVGDLDEVPEAIEELDTGWVQESAQGAKAFVEDLVAQIRVDLAKVAIGKADRLVAAMKADKITQEEAVAELDKVLAAEIRDAIGLLQSLRDLEGTVLHD